MAIYLSSLEHSRVPIEVREVLSFPRAEAMALDQKIASLPDVSGCVLLSTCNRTELYVSSRGPSDPAALLCTAAGVDWTPFDDAFESCANGDAVRHLLEVACGVRSRIWGEDQILSQVRDALVMAREAGTTNSTLETLFRIAVSAGKEVRTAAKFSPVPVSSASKAVDLLAAHTDLDGKRVLVIGNGEMGRLSAGMLRDAGCDVTVTLRTYRHGETVVPAGCSVVPYADRYDALEDADILLSATASPHFTVTREQLEAVQDPPGWIVDLAIPRDVEPEIDSLPGITVFNVDDLEDFDPGRDIPPEVEQILNNYEARFFHWANYRDCMPAMEDLKRAVADRMLTAKELTDGDVSPEELVEITVSRTVDMLAGGLSEQWTAELLDKTSEKIRAHTRGAEENVHHDTQVPPLH
ncbi:MAG: glutamyl-tRNA reductase [Oscillospiraceae bacterium]|nr:glutamyl-tRNA reductase [Oscillospiraceae bacterium]